MVTMPVDLSHYLSKIFYQEDKLLFNEAVICGASSALRACYLMLWMTLVESLKRRFIEIGKSDSEIGKIVGELRNKEQKQIAADKYILEQSKKFGFISDQTHLSLEYFYNLRSVLIHPYSTNVTEEQIEFAASIIVNDVLANPIKLRFSYGEQLVNRLLEPHYIDNTEESVTALAKSVQLRIDMSIMPWLVKKYLTELDKIYQDKTNIMRIRLLNRGIWFIRSMILNNIALFSEQEYHDLFLQFPFILTIVLSVPHLYVSMSERVRYSIVQYMFDKHGEFPKFLHRIEVLFQADILSAVHAKHLIDLIATSKFRLLRDCGLSTELIAPRVLKMLQSSSYETSNQAIDFIKSSAFKLDALDNQDKIDLGIRLAYQYENNNFKAINYVKYDAETNLPSDAIMGLMLGCFINPFNRYTISVKTIEQIFSIKIDQDQKEGLSETIIQYIDASDATNLSFYESNIEELDTLYPDNEIIKPIIDHL